MQADLQAIAPHRRDDFAAARAYAEAVSAATGREASFGVRIRAGRPYYNFSCVTGGYGSTMAEAIDDWRAVIRRQLGVQAMGYRGGTAFARCYGEINAERFQAALDAYEAAEALREVGS